VQDDSVSRYNHHARRKSLNIFFGFATDVEASSTTTGTPTPTLTPPATSEGTFTKWKRKIQRKARFHFFLFQKATNLES
jgi:hypothetical protein